jgi:transcriptional regulator with XRE-family HTH domain
MTSLFYFLQNWLAFSFGMFYNLHMTIDEINEKLRLQGWTNRRLADELGVNESSLGQILKGNRPLTEQLSRHIEYVLGKREAVLVYRVDVPTHKVEELTAGRGCVTEADHREALQAIIEHNLQELAKLGAELEWTPEQREALGIATQQPGAGYDVREPFA